MPPASTTSHTLTNSQQHDSTYHYEHDSMAIAYLRAIPQITFPSDSHAADMLPAAKGFGSFEGFGCSNGSRFVPPDTLVVEHWHTRHRDRVVVKTDTVYQAKEIIIHSPPVKYVPKIVKWLAYIGAAAIGLLLLRLLWKIRG